MPLVRKTFTDRPARLDFTMNLPEEFVETQQAREKHDFGQERVHAPLLICAPPTEQAAIRITARPGLSGGTVRDWFQSFCIHHEIRLLSIGPTYVGGLRKNHPAIMAGGLTGEDDTEMVFSFVAIEDGGRFIVASASCTRRLEPRRMSTLEKCIHSFELLHHLGPTVNVEDNGAKYEIEILEEQPATQPLQIKW